MGLRSASLAEQHGYRQVRVYKEGLPAWRKAALPVVIAPEFAATILDEHHVFVDLRPAAGSRQGHIPTAVGVPAVQIRALDGDPSAKKTLPGLRDKLAPVVIYDADGADALGALEILSRWGFASTVILDGGFAAWSKGRFPIAAGVAPERVTFTRKPLKGAVGAEEFTRLVASKMAVILDVREDDEVAKGMIPGAVHIPLGKLDGEMEKLAPADKIVIHCAVGARARMAYIRLTIRGYQDVHFLDDVINVRPDGTFCIDCGE